MTIRSEPAAIKVWDPFVRVFHWSLATLFLAAYATAEDAGQLHIAAGYAIGGLVALRIAWGFVGPCHARFSNFVRSPREVLAMIVALLVMLLGTGITGYMMTTDAFWGAKWVEEVHETFADLTVGLVVFHVLGVLLSSFLHEENLVKSMVTGRKRHS